MSHQSGNQNRSQNKNRPEPLAEIERLLIEKPFRPHRVFSNAHAQTIGGYFWPRRFWLKPPKTDEVRLFNVEPGVQVLAQCRWQPDRTARPTMILVHGMEGSSSSIYIVGTAQKAYRQGFNVVRLNLRTCGNTEHLTPTLYHSGLISDLMFVVDELASRDQLKSIFLVGFSMSGNMALKLAGEKSESLARELLAICTVSPSVNLSLTADMIEMPSNRLYQRSFLNSLRRRIKKKHQLFPDRFDKSKLRNIRTIRDFDNSYTAVEAGYKDAEEYYRRSSSLDVIDGIRRPVLIIHAEDDPFIPFEPLREKVFEQNSHIIMLTPKHGGHVGFLGHRINGEDRFWAENRIVEFCKLVNDRVAS